jgi:hypothetical protein
MADRIELLDDEQEALRMAMDGRLSSVWVSIPGIVSKVYFDKMTLEVQPAIQGSVEDQYGNVTNVNLPVLVDVPIIFPSAGGFTLTLPIKIGDEVLVIFASRCIDSWWQSGGIGVPMEQRMHDLSDGFAILGPKSQPKKISNISSTNAQLRNDAGDTFLEISTGGKIKLTALTEIDLTAPVIKLNGATTVTGGLGIDGKTFATHVHINTQPGSGNSGVPL